MACLIFSSELGSSGSSWISSSSILSICIISLLDFMLGDMAKIRSKFIIITRLVIATVLPPPRLATAKNT
eukprot:858713-Pleurochrysis_carterae.AAC.1